LTLGRIAATHGRFNHICQPAPPACTPLCLGPYKPTSQMAFRSVQPFLHRWWQSVPIHCNGLPLFSLKISHSHGDLHPHRIHGSLDPPQYKKASWSVQPFSHSSWQRVQICNNGLPLFPPKLPLHIGGSWPLSKTQFLGSNRVHNPNGISIGSAIFAGLTSVTDQPTDRPRYSVYNNMPYLHSTAMQPKKISYNICAWYLTWLNYKPAAKHILYLQWPTTE